MQHPDLVQIDSEQISGVWHLFRTHPTVGSCMQAINNFVFGRGLEFAQPPKNVPEDLMPLVCRSYHRAAIASIEWMQCIGIVPMTFQSLSGLPDILVPVVPVPESLDLFVRISETGEKIFEAVFKKNLNLLHQFTVDTLHSSVANVAAVAKVVVWSSTQYPPTADGRLVTPMTHLQNSEEFINFMKRRALIAEHIRSNPPIVSQNRHKTNSDNEGIAFGVPEKTVRELNEQDAETRELRAQHQMNLHTAWTENTVPKSAPETQEFLQETRPHEYFICEERDHQRVEQAASVPNLPELLRWAEEKIFQIFGLPLGYSQTRV